MYFPVLTKLLVTQQIAHQSGAICFWCACRQAFDIPPYSFKKSNRQAPLILFPSDWAVTPAEPMSPHAVSIGPITAAPAKPLPSDLEDFVQSAGEHGVVYASLGTTAIPGQTALWLLHITCIACLICMHQTGQGNADLQQLHCLEDCRFMNVPCNISSMCMI